MQLREVLKDVTLVNKEIPSLPDGEVSSVSDNSREVQSGTLFFAICGTSVDGRRYIPEAIKKGAVGVVLDSIEGLDNFENYSIPIIQVDDTRLALALSARAFYHNPSSSLKCVGVTGTNGKTSVCWILAQALSNLSSGAAYSGTLGSAVIEKNHGELRSLIKAGSLTTPGAQKINSFLANAKEKDLEYAVFEVSSHAIAQHRMTGVEWDLGIFTNLTRDHLDFHNTIEAYAQCKKRFFSEMLCSSRKNPVKALINIDDEFGSRLADELRAECPELEIATYGTAEVADGRIRSVEGDLDKMKISVEIFGSQLELCANLVGTYNTENLLAASQVLLMMGFKEKDIEKAVANVEVVPGRLERIGRGDIAVFVDYAHTPDALDNAQQSLCELTTGRLITVFGSGGDRDRGKRPLMGGSVYKYADIAVVTSDNPRSEVPEKIIAEILSGMPVDSDPKHTCKVVVERDEAIDFAIQLAEPGDTVLIAGKGHENYQEVKGIRYPLSDMELARSALNRREQER